MLRLIRLRPFRRTRLGFVDQPRGSAPAPGPVHPPARPDAAPSAPENPDSGRRIRSAHPAGSPWSSPDGHWLRVVLVVAPLTAIGIAAAGIVLSLVSSPVQVLTAVVLPAAILGTLALGERPGPRLVAAIGLDVEALLTGASSPAGMAFAVVLPLIAVGLVQPIIRGRLLAAVFGLSAATATLGVAEAVTIGPARDAMPTGSAVLTVISFAAVTAFALALEWRASRHLSAVIASAETEIAERTSAEGRLRETSEILSAILTSSPVSIQAFDRNRRIIVWNPASERAFGWTADELVGQPLPAAMVAAEDRESSRERIERTLAGATINGDRVRRLTKDGDERWVDIYAAPLVGRDGAPIGIAGQMVDVTDRVRIEAQLAQAQKMGAVGLLASGIAHDFNNTLTAAGGYAELLRASSDESVRADATTLIAVLERGRQLTRRLLDFARRGDGAAAMVDVREVIVGVEPLLRRLIGNTVAVELALAAEPLPATIQVGQLEQALINLAINARDAMPGGGRLQIAVQPAAGRTAPATEGAGRTIIVVEPDRSIRHGDVEITVTDDGDGIPLLVLASVFEPFFTTKPVGVGTGLGLAMVRGFVEAAAGELSVTSEVGVGTTFAIRLPHGHAAAG
jgi:PAS domain S-box-containing protein